MPEPHTQQVPTLVWLLQSGGLAPLALGLVLAAIAIIFVVRPNRKASLILAFLALLPAIFALVVVYSATAEFNEMAMSPTPPQPAEFARITSRAMGSSFCGLLGTVLPAFVALLGLLRAYKSA